MTRYLKFIEYQALGGSLAEMPFNLLELKAQNEIDRYTFNRLKDLSNQVEDTKMCIFELISIFQKYESMLEKQSDGIASENIDGYSVSYVTSSQDTIKSQKQEIKDCIRRYLIDCRLSDGTPYLYCGVNK